MFTEQQKAELNAPLLRGDVKTRKQSGQTLSYIEGWHAIAEANRIFGFDAWKSETIDIRLVSEKPRKIGKEPNQRDGWGVSYVAKVRITVGDIVREGVGAGHGIDVDVGLAHESAIKEAETDARKRGLMTFGNPFGLALYDREQSNVADEPRPEPEPATPNGMVPAFVERRLIDIRRFDDETKLRDWWESEDEKAARRTVGLDGSSLEALKSAVVLRRDTIRQQQRKAA